MQAGAAPGLQNAGAVTAGRSLGGLFAASWDNESPVAAMQAKDGTARCAAGKPFRQEWRLARRLAFRMQAA